MLVQVPLRARPHRMRRRPGGRRSGLCRGHRARPLRLHWEAGCEQLLLKIPRGKLDAIGQRAFGDRAAGLQPALRLDNPVGAAWHSMMGGLIHLLPTLDDGAPRPPAAWLDQLVVLHLLYNQPNTWRGGPAAAPPPGAGRAYMRAHLATPMTLKDIARHAGGDTALTRLFQEHRDTTPMNALRALRLDAARQRCWTAPAPTSPRRRWASATWAGFRSTTRKDSANCPGRPCAWRSDRGRAARAGSSTRHSVPDAGPVSGTADGRSPDRRADATGRPAQQDQAGTTAVTSISTLARSSTRSATSRRIMAGKCRPISSR